MVSGPVLDGIDSEWALAWRVESSRAVPACALGLARGHLAAGDPETARQVARLGVRAVPYDDGLWVVLLEAAAAAGLGAMSAQWDEIVTVGRVPPSTGLVSI